ncbi:hypothetical protein ACFQ3S_14820 [Mucilaginibacter terrae]
MLIFAQDDAEIELFNPGISPASIILFGGEPYTEPIIMRAR